MLSSFAVGPFRRVWLAALAGNSGRFAVILVAGWEAYRLGHHSSVWPSLVAFLLLIPSMLLGLLAGGLADRVDRRRQAAAGQLVNAVACTVGGVLALTGGIELGEVLVVAAVVGVGNALQGPAWQAMIAGLVGPARLRNAAMMTRIAQQGAELTGPATGTLLLAAAGPGPTFLLCAWFYLAGVGLLWSAGARANASAGTGTLAPGTTALPPCTSAPTPGRPASVLRGEGRPVRSGLAYLGQPPLATLLIWVGLHCSLTMASIGILPAVATANLRGEVGAYGLLLSAFGLGSVVGPLAMMWAGDRADGVRSLVGAGLLSGLALVGLGLSRNEALVAAASALAGAAQAVFMSLIFAFTQGVAVDAMRGRVASVQLALTTGAMGLASLGWGGLVGLFPPGDVLALPGLAFALACAPFAGRASALRTALGLARRRPAAG